MRNSKMRLMFSETPDWGDFGADNAGAGSPSGADSEVLDFSQFGIEDSITEPTATVEQPQAQQVKRNPAWDPILQQVPDAFHGQIEPTLKEWDRNFQAKAQELAELRKQYEPFEAFKGLDPQYLQASVAIAQDLQRDPVAFFNDLKTRLVQAGRLEEAAQVQQVQNAAEAQGNAEGEQDPYERQMQELRRGQEQLQNTIAEQMQQQQYQQDYAEAEADIQQSFTNIEQQIGQTLSDPLKARVIQENLMLQQQFGRPVSIEESFVSVQKFLAEASRARRVAPKVMPGNAGGVRSPEVPNLAESKDARKSALSLYLTGQQ